MTDEQAIHAIWELLSEEERPEGLFWDKQLECWYDDGGYTCYDPIAHRAILDAAMELVQTKLCDVYFNINGTWTWMDRSQTPMGDCTTRTLAIYHAIAWLKGKSE